LSVGGLGLAFVAGLLSVLSPCVLPLLPIVFGAAASEHRGGPIALALGLSLSFTAIGLFVAVIGFSIGLDTEVFRAVAAVLLIAVGAILIVPGLQVRLAVAGGPVSNWTEHRLGRFSTAGVGGQFAVGLLLGAVWIPCVGPTLGAASLLASRGESLGEVAAVMIVFGLGAALPLAVLGLLSREVLLRWRGRLVGAGKGLQIALGAVLIANGALIATRVDTRLQRWLVEAQPDWLLDLTTRF
jgi:cytochrome c biogenesis protein CcdA